ncbi:hypothetical protein DYB32_009959 [Aphanomyces invadans]|uniref:DDE Tnp4 domain-containing protein n=1 Tax=Aphanomyces invadans TaxID=157072 RepID=A0A3R6YX25_9STRA|nr:hypothetical protein DYB32_009959 [Aphanomyces invadans]
MTSETTPQRNRRNDMQLAQRAAIAVATRNAKRQTERERFSTSPREDGEEADSIHPIFDSFVVYDNVQSMTNLTVLELENLWYALKPRVMRTWNVGKGRKSPYSGKVMLFMLVTIFKSGGTWQFLSALFGFQAPTFEKMMTRFLTKVSDHVYDLFVADEVSIRAMTHLVATGKTFQNYPAALYAVDATFQQSNRPLGSHNEALYAFSGKHHLYGKKVEVAVSPSGFALHVSQHVPGSVHDKTLFDQNSSFHSDVRKKRPSEVHLEDSCPLRETFSDQWALLADKGYQGVQHVSRAILPARASRNHRLTASQESTNQRIATDRIIVENWFGRNYTLWGIVSDKYNWSNDLYDPIFRLCAGLTNYHIRFTPLRTEEATTTAEC